MGAAQGISEAQTDSKWLHLARDGCGGLFDNDGTLWAASDAINIDADSAEAAKL